MITQEQIIMLQALANGCDPTTGELFPPDSLYNKPEIIRAIANAVFTLQEKKATNLPLALSKKMKAKQASNIANGNPGNHGLRWQPQDKEHVINSYKEGEDLRQVAAMIERKPTALLSVLYDAKLINTDKQTKMFIELANNRKAN